MEILTKTNTLKRKNIKYETLSGAKYDNLNVSYQVFGKSLNNAPVVLVIHALTGNSNVANPDKGWWKDLIGESKLIDTQKFSVIAFNIPGNGYDGHLIESYKDFTARDIGIIFKKVLSTLGVQKLHATIGGSLGGGIAWEMAVLFPSFSKYIIPIATDWKSTDWIIGHNAIQESILLNSKKPIHDARKMAMLFYRTPISFKNRFNRGYENKSKTYSVSSWLDHHGRTLEKRFTVKAYLMMNHLLTTIDIVRDRNSIGDALSCIKSKIIQIAINSDLFFVKEEIITTKNILDKLGKQNAYYEIKSKDGHDAFLIEHKQLTKYLYDVFN